MSEFYVDENSGLNIQKMWAWFRKVGHLITVPPPAVQPSRGDSADREVYECQLTGTLTAGGNTTAKLLKWNSSSEEYEVTGSEFTVYDDLYGTLEGEDGNPALFMWRHKRRVLIGVACE